MAMDPELPNPFSMMGDAMTLAGKVASGEVSESEADTMALQLLMPMFRTMPSEQLKSVRALITGELVERGEDD